MDTVSETITYSVNDGVAYIMLNRPNVFNSFNREMALALQQRLNEASSDPVVRAIYLSGTGKGFCAGQDLQEATATDGPPILDIVEQHYNPIIMAIRSIEKPVVAGVNGVAAGAGANVALACDVVIAKKSAVFIQAFSAIGLIPDSGGTYTLPRLIGWQKASALMMTGDRVDAVEAERIGMIYRWVEDEMFESESRTLAQKLASMPTKGLGLTKKLLNLSAAHTLEQQLTAEGHQQVIAASTEDFREGVNAFLEKRKPAFKGQ